MALAEIKPMTVDQFLAWQFDQDDLYELVSGVPQKLVKIRRMAGATQVHDGIVTRTIVALGQQLHGRPCRKL